MRGGLSIVVFGLVEVSHHSGVHSAALRPEIFVYYLALFGKRA